MSTLLTCFSSSTALVRPQNVSADMMAGRVPANYETEVVETKRKEQYRQKNLKENNKRKGKEMMKVAQDLQMEVVSEKYQLLTLMQG